MSARRITPDGLPFLLLLAALLPGWFRRHAEVGPGALSTYGGAREARTIEDIRVQELRPVSSSAGARTRA